MLPEKRLALADIQRLMATQIKLDIARELRFHPHMTVATSRQAYAQLANDETVNELVRELAKEEVEAAIARGELPAAAFLHLAGYLQNALPEG